MTMQAREFDNILGECLERVLGGGTVAQCLAAYPGYAAELEPLLRTALASKEALDIRPRPEFREIAGQQFQAAIREMPLPAKRGLFGWQRRWAITAIVVVVLLLAGSSTVAAASNSLPDQPLYTVKLATEEVRLALTPSALGKAELYAKLADKRVDEIIKMADKGKVPQVEQATERLDGYLVAMTNLLVPAGEEAGLGSAALEAAPAEAPPEEAPRAMLQAPVTAPALAPEPSPAPTPRPVPAPAPAPVPAPALVPGLVMEAPPPEAAPEAALKAPEATMAAPEEDNAKKAKPDKEAELKALLARLSVDNPEALRAALEKVPEEARPALLRALKVTGGYERVLEYLNEQEARDRDEED